MPSDMEQAMTRLPDYSQHVDILISEKACDGCGLCVDFCPVGVLKMGDSIPKIIKLTACYDCGTCEDLCPRGAIKIEPRRPEREQGDPEVRATEPQKTED